MDGNFMKQVRRVLFLEFLFSGTSNLSKSLKETELELEDMIRLIDENPKIKGVMEGKLFKK